MVPYYSCWYLWGSNTNFGGEFRIDLISIIIGAYQTWLLSNRDSAHDDQPLFFSTGIDS